jgi:1,4-alpha-glucan branching enzyme
MFACCYSSKIIDREAILSLPNDSLTGLNAGKSPYPLQLLELLVKPGSLMASQIEFQLFAPYNKGAALIGSFSDWKDIPMEKGEDGYFRTQVELEDGVYQYKFRVQSKSWFFEPINGLKSLTPTPQTSMTPAQNGNVRIKDGERIVDTYVWKHDDKPLPADHELVIYEVHVGDFSGGEDDPYARGKYKHVVEKLDYLADLGLTRSS